MGTGNKPVFTLKQMTLICEKMCKVLYFIEYNKIDHDMLVKYSKWAHR
jgi:hypothetical protein